MDCRCSRCGRRCSGYDASGKPRRWRGLDLGSTQVFLQATTRRVSCPEHGVVVAAVPWARPGSRFTTAFEDTCAWLVCHATLSVVAVLLRVAWRSVSDGPRDFRTALLVAISRCVLPVQELVVDLAWGFVSES
ncbi:MAG: helix-turn-helix domain-containing protein [Pseudonocardiaceae bacterium]